MTSIVIEREHRTHFVDIEGPFVKSWKCKLNDSDDIHTMSYQQKAPYKVYSDKKGNYIKLSCDGKTHKHYV